MAEIKPNTRQFTSTYLTIDIEIIESNINNLIQYSPEFWPVELNLLDYHICNQDGHINGEINREDIHAIIEKCFNRCDTITFGFKNKTGQSAFGIELHAPEYIDFELCFREKLITIRQCVTGLSTSSRVVSILTDNIKMIHAQLPEAHRNIEPALHAFHSDHPDFDKNIFLIMRFDANPPFPEILSTITETCTSRGLKLLRADQKSYSDDLWHNVLTYIYGCKYGIAVFDQVNYRDYNPNVAIEVGFMMSQSKRILLLKDQAMNSLPTDIVGKIYRPFNTYQPSQTIPPQILKWFHDCNL